MKDRWYCRVDGQQYGPYGWDQLRAMAKAGQIVPETFVRREVDQQWYSAAKIPGLLASKKPAQPEPAIVNSRAGETMCKSASDTDKFPAVNVPEPAGPPKPEPLVQAMADSPKAARPEQKAGVAAARPKAREAAPKAQQTARDPAFKLAPKTASPTPAAPTATVSEKPAAPVAAAPAPPPVADSPLGIVIAPPPVAALRGRPAVQESKPPKKGLSPLVIVGAIGGVVAVVLLVGVGLVVWRLNNPAVPDEKVVAKATETKVAKAEEPPAISEAQLDALLGPKSVPETPAKADDAKDKAAGKSASPNPSATGPAAAPAAATAPTVDPKLAAARQLVASQPKWSPVEGMKIRSRDMSIVVAAVWLASDLAGTRIEPTLPEASKPTGGAGAAAESSATIALSATGSAPSDPAEPAKHFVFVEIRATNTGGIPRKYTSWNTGDATIVVLADAHNEPLPLVPASQTPDVTRQTSLYIPAGQTISDVLVFQAPAKPFESLRLLLAQSVLASGQRGYFPIEVPVEFLFKKAEPLAKAAESALPAGPSATGAGEVKAADGKPGDPNVPLSRDDFTKLLEADKKALDAAKNPAPKGDPKP